MLTRADLHPYQRVAVDFLRDHPRAALHLDMGLGKSISTGTAIADMLDRSDTYGVLILAPRRVAETVWAQELAKWEHTRHLRVCVLRGRSKPLLARDLLRDYDVWVINYEAIPWLVGELEMRFIRHREYPPFDTLVFDELSRTKNPMGKRMQQLKPLLRFFRRRIGLTGTPAPNGYWDLFGQYLVLDDGQRLGNDQQIWKEQYFIEDVYARKRYPAPGAKEQIEAAIGDITLSMRDTDHLDLPPQVFNDVRVQLPEKVRTQYEEFEREMFTEIDGYGSLEVFNMAALTNKCRQLANGAVIDSENPDRSIPVHDAKLEALDDIVEEAAGQSVLVAYVFRVDMRRIVDRYRRRGLQVAYLGPGVGDNAATEIVNTWNAGRYDLLVTHPMSAGHGLNLQHGGHQIAWFGLDWNLEGWLQMNARLRRQGQRARTVIVHRIIAEGTIDEAVKDALEHKVRDQEGLRAALDYYRKTKKR